MRSSQVYQPTTTTLNYDRHKAWVPSFLANSSSSSTWSRTVMLSLSVLFAIMGVVMIIVGATSYNAIEEGSFTQDNATAYIIILCVGILLEIAAIAAVIMYYRTLGYYIPCCPGKIARIRKRLHENQMVVNGQVVNVGEPVSAQYCPPAQPVVGSTPPPPYTDISEEQRLMDEKPDIGSFLSLNCWIESRMIAPLASVEDLTPSLLLASTETLDVSHFCRLDGRMDSSYHQHHGTLNSSYCQLNAKLDA